MSLKRAVANKIMFAGLLNDVVLITWMKQHHLGKWYSGGKNCWYRLCIKYTHVGEESSLVLLPSRPTSLARLPSWTTCFTLSQTNSRTVANRRMKQLHRSLPIYCDRLNYCGIFYWSFHFCLCVVWLQANWRDSVCINTRPVRSWIMHVMLFLHVYAWGTSAVQVIVRLQRSVVTMSRVTLIPHINTSIKLYRSYMYVRLTVPA